MTRVKVEGERGVVRVGDGGGTSRAEVGDGSEVGGDVLARSTLERLVAAVW